MDDHIKNLEQKIAEQNKRLDEHNKQFLEMMTLMRELRAQKSLKWLLQQKISTPFQQFRLSKLMGFDYEIVYKSGVENLVAHTLSRKEKEDQRFYVWIYLWSLLMFLRKLKIVIHWILIG